MEIPFNLHSNTWTTPKFVVVLLLFTSNSNSELTFLLFWMDDGRHGHGHIKIQIIHRNEQFIKHTIILDSRFLKAFLGVY